MRLILPTRPPSRHRRDLWAVFNEAVRSQLRPGSLSPRIYKVRVEYHGHWYKDAWTPLRRDADSALIVLFDVLASVGGIDDKWFQTDFHVTTHESSQETVIVDLT